MAHPYQLIAAIGLLIAIYGSGFWTGHRWAEGDAAIAAGKAVAVAVEKAKAESDEQMKVALKAEKTRTAARLRQQKLEQELSKDELAKTCHVSAGTFGVLNLSIDAANQTIASGGHGAVQSDTKPAGFIRSGFGAVDWLLGTGSRGGVPAAAKLNRLDQ
jgi:hypothetical protein